MYENKDEPDSFHLRCFGLLLLLLSWLVIEDLSSSCIICCKHVSGLTVEASMMRRVVLSEVLSTCCSRVGLVDADCEYLHGFSVYGKIGGSTPQFRIFENRKTTATQAQ